ncbi:MAG: tRNA (adenosine(37)-N6)-dimethylallyltransferase MiaA [Spirochaetia bacterium]|nr:tRNA (adenosine(37)-N6)-dimethylallyltransferase MiaA [Spirochaetia bacterium]
MKPVIVLTGPTGCGKSHIIYNLPQNLPIEIINADSRQIYRFMKIGTALPDQNEIKRFKHHMFEFLDPSEAFSAGQYIQMCKNIIHEIHLRNNIPVIVGGSFFYIKSLWDGLIENVQINPITRDKVNQLTKEKAHELLCEIDPERGQKLNPSDEHRVKRSLMLVLSTDRRVSQLKKSGEIYSKYDFQSFYIDMDRSVLYEQINKRVMLMFQNGLIDEIKKLTKMGYTIHDPGLNAIGYKEILEISESRNLTLDNWTEEVKQEAVLKISKSTRNFAKRQLTWFRNQDRLKRIDPLYAVSLLSELILQYKKKEESL